MKGNKNNLVLPIGAVNITKAKCVLSKKYEGATFLARTVSKAVGSKIDDKYVFGFQINYKGSKRLKPEDILITNNGLKFFVEREQSWQALIVCGDPLALEPNIISTLKIYRNNED
jgi:hypothetical protein|tara:strand:+ start:769 stop:1113 length:345 start_codon:yes stop_codon:yes gene_type:complete